jgi:hypothetical protein
VEEPIAGSPGRYFLSIKPGCVRKSKLFNGGEQFLNGIAVSMSIVGDLKICVENVPGGSYRRVTEFMAPHFILPGFFSPLFGSISGWCRK